MNENGLKKNSSEELTLEELEELDKVEEETDESISQHEEDHIGKSDRCLWCNAEDSEDFRLFKAEFIQDKETSYFISCSMDHEMKVKKFYNFTNRFKFLYYLLVLLFPITFLFLTFLLSEFFLILIFFSIGLGLLILPLLGQRTVQSLGLKNSTILGRVLGGILILISVTIYLLGGGVDF